MTDHDRSWGCTYSIRGRVIGMDTIACDHAGVALDYGSTGERRTNQARYEGALTTDESAL
jgi:hypothetical protein